MGSFNLSLVALSFLCAAGLISQYRQRTRRRGHALPPGPKRWPVIGNLLDLKVDKPPGVLFEEWASMYGELFYLKVLRTPIIVISSAQVVSDLLEKRSAIYSDRTLPVLDEISGWTWNIVRMAYGQRWRDTRRWFHQYFNQAATLKYRDVQIGGAHGLIRRIKEAGGRLDPPLLRFMLASVITELFYGIKINSMEAEYVQTAEAAIKVILDSRTPGTYWIEYAPFLKYIPGWMPGGRATRVAAKCRPVIQRARDYGFDLVKSGQSPNDCIVRSMIEHAHKADEEEEVMKREEVARDASGSAYAAAVDTTLSFLSFGLCAIAMHPEVQKKVQDELDRVVGPNRLPSFEDYDSLPYVRAVLLESARWVPVTPLGIAHKVSEDDFYNGYFIPKGTIIYPNMRVMLHDPEDYPDPERFNPERFLKDGKLNPAVRDPTTLAFGFGRRICPGRHFAKDNGFIIFTSLLHVFDVTPGVSKDGDPLDPTPTHGSVSHPKRMVCSLKPRSEAAEKLIRLCV